MNVRDAVGTSYHYSKSAVWYSLVAFVTLGNICEFLIKLVCFPFILLLLGVLVGTLYLLCLLLGYPAARLQWFLRNRMKAKNRRQRFPVGFWRFPICVGNVTLKEIATGDYRRSS